MAITAAGVGSGLDIESIVSQLMTIERRPLDTLERRERDVRAEISAYGRLKSAVAGFESAMSGLGSLDKFKVFTGSSSDDTVATISANSSAAAGLYDLEVIRLAQNHKQASDPFASTDTFGGGAGDALTLTIGTDSMTVDLSSAQTLADIRSAINSASDNPGVTATILNVGGGDQRLILTSNESGADNQLQLSYGGAIGAATFNFATLNKDENGVVLSDLADLDASLTIDGFAVTSASNKVTSAVDGITFELASLGSATLTVARDSAAITESVESFVDAYNTLSNTIRDMQAGDLSGDGSLLSIRSQLFSVLNTAPTGLTGSYIALSQVGITTNSSDGTLELDSSDLTAALDADFQGVAELFAHDDQGIAFRFEALAKQLTDTDGIIDSREESLDSRIRSLDNQQAEWERRLELKEVQLRSQFAALDSLLGQMQGTSTFIAAQLFQTS